jgi:hypothetical protein
MGSRVIRGNLLVIPIEDSLLYVSPLYLRATQGHLPELKRVIAAYGEHVVMKETLAEALSALFMEPGAAPAASNATTGTLLGGPAADRAREALDRYNQAIGRLKAGGLGGLRRRTRRDTRAFGGYEPATGRPLRCHGEPPLLAHQRLGFPPRNPKNLPLETGHTRPTCGSETIPQRPTGWPPWKDSNRSAGLRRACTAAGNDARICSPYSRCTIDRPAAETAAVSPQPALQPPQPLASLNGSIRRAFQLATPRSEAGSARGAASS